MFKLFNPIKKIPLLGLFLAISVNQASATEYANVTAVSVSGNAQNYRFSVTINSPDTGCEQYANWWEVLNNDGKLLYRRILGHSHVGEQPFTRSGGMVKADTNETLYIRAHLFPSGYGGVVLVGNAENGFKSADVKTTTKVIAFDTKHAKTNCAF